MNKQKDINLYSVIAACLFATCFLYQLLNYFSAVQYYPVFLKVLQFLSVCVLAFMAVWIFMGRIDWVLFGAAAGNAAICLLNLLIAPPTLFKVLMLFAALGVAAIIFLRMKRIKIVKYLFFVPAALMLIASLLPGSTLRNAIMIYTKYHAFDFTAALLEQMEIAAYLMLGFWFVKTLDETAAPKAAMPTYAPQQVYAPQMPLQQAYTAPAAQSAPGTQGIRYCMRCGAANSAEDLFCAQCGSRL